MSHTVGIDLGTTNSLIGAVESGFPLILADPEQHRLTPSVVHFPENGPPLVGRDAVRAGSAFPHRTVFSVKRLIGLTTTATLTPRSYPIHEGGGGLLISMGENDYSPAEISALILRKLRSDAEHRLERQVTRAVITVPAYFNDLQRAATIAAGELAGLEVARIVNEPTAAALALGLDQGAERCRIAVFDLGGGTFDVTILELREGIFQVLATCGDTALGGDDLDQGLVRYLQPHLGQILDGDLTPIELARVREACRLAREKLSEEPATRLELPFLRQDRSLSLELTRETLEQVARPILQRMHAPTLRALADAQTGAADLSAVVLVGGVTRMPLVRELAAQWFERAPDTSAHPDETVALGATLQAGVLDGSIRNMLLLDVTPLSLGIETFGGLMNVIIPRNTTIPAKAGELFTNAVPHQQSLLVHVLQGERELAKDNLSLGKFELPFETDARGTGRAGVQLEIDANGLLTVLARDTRTGAEKKLKIKRALPEDQRLVREMVEASVAHAFEDMEQRRHVERTNKAKELIHATHHALQAAGHLLKEAEHLAIKTLIEELESALFKGEGLAIDAAMQTLDEGTQDLAARVMDLLMEG